MSHLLSFGTKQVKSPTSNRHRRCRRHLVLSASCLLPLLLLCGVAEPYAKSEQDLRLLLLDRADGGIIVMTDHVDHPTKVEIDRETAAKLASVRFTIECSADDECSDQKLAPVEGHRQVLDDRALKEFLDEAGNRILTPFAEHIRKASRLRMH